MSRNHPINDPLAVIYNEGCWKVNKVSPMHNLRYSELKLKQYATKIRQALVSSAAANSKHTFNVLIENMPRLKYTEDDSNGLLITVSSTQDDSNNKILYVALLLSWGISISMNGAEHLPYMLEHGEQRAGIVVKNMLQMMFDCNITQYSFTQHQLLQFCFNLIENDTSRSRDPITLSFKTPQINIKNELSMTFEIGDVYAIWNRVKEEIASESESLYLAIQLLHNQIREVIALDMIEIDLCEVILPKAEVKCNGIIKMKTPELVNSVFIVLNKALESLISHEIVENNL